jgi:hypothetical protein
MKHRSIGGFILLAAALFAAPQVAHDLLTLKSVLGERVRAEVLHAFLSLPASDSAGGAAPRRVSPMLASWQASEKTGAQAAARAKKNDCRAPATSQAASPAKNGTPEESAMLKDPSSEFEWANAELSGGKDKTVLGAADELQQQLLTPSQLAMLIPPGTGVDVPGVAALRACGSKELDAARQSLKAAEVQRRVAYVAARYVEHVPELRLTVAEFRRRFDTVLPGAYEVRPDGDGVRVRDFKLRRQGKSSGGVAPSVGPAQPSKQVASLAPEAPTPAPQALAASE